ncbi:MAG: hypothetical protein Q4A94_12040, partial [Plesiomonas sp.]|nr:hypothetical protein [Plesiomonas sp.]
LHQGVFCLLSDFTGSVQWHRERFCISGENGKMLHRPLDTVHYRLKHGGQTVSSFSSPQRGLLQK